MFNVVFNVIQGLVFYNIFLGNLGVFSFYSLGMKSLYVMHQNNAVMKSPLKGKRFCSIFSPYVLVYFETRMLFLSYYFREKLFKCTPPTEVYQYK